MDDALRQAVFEQWHTQAEGVASCTEPIYVRNKHRRLAQCGSGVLIRYGSQQFIVSAAHVFAGGDERWLGGERSRTSLSSVFRTCDDTDVPPPLRDLDLAIAPLSAPAVACLGDARFLTMADIEPDACAPGALCCVVGYACADRRLAFRDDEPLQAKWTTLGAKAAPAERYDAAELSHRTHLLLDFDRERTEGPQRIEATPKLNGMSGCGIWRMSDTPASSRLAAILTAYRAAGGRHFIVATRIAFVVRALAGYVAGELAPDDVANLSA